MIKDEVNAFIALEHNPLKLAQKETRAVGKSSMTINGVLYVIDHLAEVVDVVRQHLPTLFGIADALVTRDSRTTPGAYQTLMLVCSMLNTTSSHMSTLPLFFGLLLLSYRVHYDVVHLVNQV